MVRLIFIGAAIASAAVAHAETPFELQQDEVVVFLGGTNMVRLQRAGYLETFLANRFSNARPKFRDLSWEADTVYRLGTVVERWRPNGFGNRDEQLKRVGATTIVAQFGQLESLDGNQKLDDFIKAYHRLVDAFENCAKQIVLITPIPFERPPFSTIPDLSKRNVDLAQYVDAIKTIARERKLILVDLFNSNQRSLTDNGLHIKSDSQLQVAQVIARQLNVKPTFDSEVRLLRDVVLEKHRLWYDYWRPANWKLLYGDDAERQFTRGGKDYIRFKDEWKKLLPLIDKAEQRVWLVTSGKPDPGHNRPAPEMLHGDSNADIEKELSSFSVPDGLQVNLFASDREGLTSPLAMRWDIEGRMYVTVTTTYPHVFPGDVPNDKIIMLEDIDNDGTADKSHVFADGLNIPTGLELGDGGVYVGQNTEILFLKDTDDDGKADLRRVVLGGFGNGDSHQTINSFIWSPGGELFFGQGDGCESRVETPWGSSDLFQAGFYRYRPRRIQLDPLLDDFMGPGNPWGIAFGEWGQIFSIDGAGGVTFLSPGQVPVHHRLRLKTIGKPGGYCGISYLDGEQLPKSMHGDFAVGDFKANRVQRFSVEPKGSGFSLDWKAPILESKHRNFRPVDVRLGPDGAVYVVDWYNPITCHQDDAYRDPTRDKAHGRIWRVSAKTHRRTNSTLTNVRKPIPNLAHASIDELLESLASPKHFTRYQAKRAMTERDSTEVTKALATWVRSLDAKLPRYEHHLYEALGAYATLEVVEPSLLRRLLSAREPRARAYAARIVGRWHDRLDQPLQLLKDRVTDNSPLVRMEAIIACAAIPQAESMCLAAHVVDRPMDHWLNYAFTQTVHQLKPHWLPAFESGDLAFSKPSHLAAVLNEAGGKGVLKSLKQLIETNDLSRDVKRSAIAAILAVGGAEDLRRYGLDRNTYTSGDNYDADLHADALARLIEAARFRDDRPDGDLASALHDLMNQNHPKLRAQALALAGIWKVGETRDRVVAFAKSGSSIETQAAAFMAMVDLELPECQTLLSSFAKPEHATNVRVASIESLVRLNCEVAAHHAVTLLPEIASDETQARPILLAFLNRENGAQALASAIDQSKLDSDTAKQLMRSLFSTGRSNESVFSAINRIIGSSAQTPDYSEVYVKNLAREAASHGDTKRGGLLFESLACSSCHQVSGSGGSIGPDLTAIGTTLSAERIVEELLWPNRQVKEGFSVVQVVTADGKIHQGFERRTKESQASGDLILEDLSTQKRTTIKHENIEDRRVTGSPMPKGLTAVLSESQLSDLVRYVTELGRIK